MKKPDVKSSCQEVLPIDENIEEDEDISNRQDEEINLSQISANNEGYGSSKKPKDERRTLNLD